MIHSSKGKNQREGDRHRQELVREVEAVVIAGLNETTRIHNDLGPDGAHAVRKNAFGETSLECDIRCEEAIIKALERAHLSATVYSEEHGIVKIGSGTELTVTVDGLDGTRRYKKAPGKERYSTMVAVLEGNDPRYSDYLVNASKQHASNLLYIASAGSGSSLCDQHGVRSLLRVSSNQSLSHIKLSYLDESFPENRKVFAELHKLLKPHCLMASCIYYEDLISGKAELVMECTRKNNLEIACAYGLVTEAGGVILLADGTSLGEQKYKTFGQEKNQHLPIISAANRTLAEQAIRLIV